MNNSKHTRLIGSAVALALAGAATLVYVEWSIGSGEPPAPTTATPTDSSASAARQAPVELSKPTVPATEAVSAVRLSLDTRRSDTRSEVVPATRVEPTRPAGRVARRPELPSGPEFRTGSSRFDVAGRLSQAEAAVFKGDFTAAEQILGELDKSTVLLQDNERAWMERLRGRMTRASELIRDVADAPVAGVFAAPEPAPGAAPAPAAPAEPPPAAMPAGMDMMAGMAGMGTPDGGSLLDRAVDFDDVIAQMTITEFNKRVAQAEELLAKKNYEVADQTALTAKGVVEANLLYLRDRGAGLIKQVEDLRAKIKSDREAEAERIRKEQEAAAIARDVAANKRARDDKVNRIRTFLRRAEEAVREGDPARALELYDLVLSLDPGNVAANARKSVISDIYDHLVKKGIDYTARRQESFQNIDLLEGRIPWYHEVRLPADWDELSRRRLDRLAEDEDPTAIRERERLDRNARKLLNTIKPTLNLPNIPLNQAFEFIRDIWGANIVVNYEALNAAAIDPEKLVNLPNLKDISLKGALELVFDQIGGEVDVAQKPSYVVDTGVIIISTTEQLAQKTATIVYDISDLVLVDRIPTDPAQVQISQFAQGTGVFTQGTQGGGGGGGGGGGLFQGGGQQNDFTTQQEEDARRNLVNEIINVVRTVSPDTFADPMAGDPNAPGQIREFQGNLIVRQTRANHDKIRKLLADIRAVSQKQVSIDVRFVQIDSSILEQILFDFDMDVTDLIFGDGQRNRGSFLSFAQSGNSNGGYGSFRFDPSLSTRGLGAGSTSSPGTPQPVDLLAFNPATGNGTAFGVGQATIQSDAVGLLVNGAIFDDVAVRFFLEATQASNRTSLYTSPKVTVLNGKKATIAVRTFRPYVANIKSNVGGGGGTGVDPIIQLAENGTTMWVRPVISHDNRFVTIQTNPILTQTDLENFPEFEVQTPGAGAGGGGGGLGGLPPTPGVRIQQPTRGEQNVFTTVKVPDKGTVILGGFKTSREIERELGTPILSKIPVVKRLFSNRSYGRSDSILVILIRPTIHLYEEIDPFFEFRPGGR